MSTTSSAVVALDHVAHDAEVAHRQRRHLRVEHACEHRPGRARRASAAAGAARSPHASREGALQVLHLGQDEAHVLAVQAALAGAAERRARPAAPGRPRRGRRSISASQASRRSAQRGPRPVAAAASSTASASNSSAHVAARAGRAPPRMRAARLVGAVAQPHHPVGGVLLVVARLLHAPCRRCRRARRRSSARSRSQSSFRKVGDDEVAQHREGEVAARQLDQREVEVVALVAQEGELVLVVAAALPRAAPARVSSARAWPTRSSAMLASAMSSSRTGAWPHHSARRWAEDQAGVADAQQVLHGGRRGSTCDRGCIVGAHMWSTTSGSS